MQIEHTEHQPCTGNVLMSCYPSSATHHRTVALQVQHQAAYIDILLCELAPKLLVQQSEHCAGRQQIEARHLARPLHSSQCYHPLQAFHTLLTHLACSQCYCGS